MTHNQLRKATLDALWVQGRVKVCELNDTELATLLAAAGAEGPEQAVEAFLEGDLDGEVQ